MNRADETAAKIETAERQSVGAAAGSDDKLAKQLEDFPGASPQSRPALHNLLCGSLITSTTSIRSET